MDPEKIEARIAEAARSFDAELHTKAYAETHSDAAQLARLLSFLSPGPDHVILDLGTGNGYVAMAIAGAHPGCHVIGVDVATQAVGRNVEQARVQSLANAHFQSYDGIALPREMHLRFRILNANFLNRQGGDVERTPSPANQ